MFLLFNVDHNMCNYNAERIKWELQPLRTDSKDFSEVKYQDCDVIKSRGWRKREITLCSVSIIHKFMFYDFLYNEMYVTNKLFFRVGSLFTSFLQFQDLIAGTHPSFVCCLMFKVVSDTIYNKYIMRKEFFLLLNMLLNLAQSRTS